MNTCPQGDGNVAVGPCLCLHLSADYFIHRPGWHHRDSLLPGNIFLGRKILFLPSIDGTSATIVTYILMCEKSTL